MQLGPRFNQALLFALEPALEHLYAVEVNDDRIVAALGVKVRTVVWAAWFSEHADDNAQEA
jgi:hypothetical protein